MKKSQVTERFGFSSQISVEHLPQLADSGVDILVCNRPDGEAADQVGYEVLAEAAKGLGMEPHLIAFKSGQMQPQHVEQFKKLLAGDNKIHAFCRTGNRSFNLYAAAALASGADADELQAQARKVEIDIAPLLKSPQPSAARPAENSGAKRAFDVVIVGGGSAGVAVASSLQRRNGKLRIAILDAASEHYYQPGWTMVGGGVFTAASTRRQMQDIIPRGINWIRSAAIGFDPEANEVEIANGSRVHYGQLIVCPGLVLDWSAIDGLEDSLGRNGVTSNYRYDLAPYTWKLVESMQSGKAVFTQPGMPIKCAGAPQKALYLSCDHWQRHSVLQNVEVDFFNAGGVLFGVSAYVPALQSYIDRYKANVHYGHTLTAIYGNERIARFKAKDANAAEVTIEKQFDMIHVCPPQRAPEFVAKSSLSDAGGWLDVDPHTLRHKKFSNIWGLGDVMNTTNAKTMAAVRKQVPVVAQNLLACLESREPAWGYDGYGSCPLTVERGKIVLAEFGYGGKLLPTFPDWLIKGTKPTRTAWWLKKDVLPAVYWHGMLKGREWMAGAQPLETVST